MTKKSTGKELMEVKAIFLKNKELSELFCFEVAIVSLILFISISKDFGVNPLINFISQKADHILYLANHNIVAAIAMAIYYSVGIIGLGLILFAYFRFVYYAIYYALSKKNLAKDASPADRNFVLWFALWIECMISIFITLDIIANGLAELKYENIILYEFLFLFYSSLMFQTLGILAFLRDRPIYPMLSSRNVKIRDALTATAIILISYFYLSNFLFLWYAPKGDVLEGFYRAAFSLTLVQFLNPILRKRHKLAITHQRK